MDKRYYYLKLKEDFFDSEEIKVLESLENGYIYSNILLKLYLKSLKTEGRLLFKDLIPYNAKMIATITGHNIDIVEKSLKVFKELGFIEILNDGAIYMSDIQSFIGSITSEGQRKAEYRARIKSEAINQITAADYTEEEINNAYNQIVETTREYAKFIYNRHAEKVKADEGIIERIKKLLPSILKVYKVEDILTIIKKTKKSFANKPEYNSCDIYWLLNNLQKIKDEDIKTYQTFDKEKTIHFNNERKYNAGDLENLIDNVEELEF